MGLVFQKLSQPCIWKRIFFERLTEPIHLNLLASLVGLVGGFRQKVAFDLVIRPQHAFGLLHCADKAVKEGLSGITAIEFGVGTGAGLLNLAEIAKRVIRETGIQIRIVGFDTGSGLPSPHDFRDHPELYAHGHYLMREEELKRKLPSFATLVVGDIAETVDHFLDDADPEFPIAFVSLDVDYYWSAKQALRIFLGRPELYLSTATVYVDDIQAEEHNRFCGEYLAIDEFNQDNHYRKLDRFNFLEYTRIFRRARWIRQMYTLHVLDHPLRTVTHDSKTGATTSAGFRT